ncbi:MAG: hypothetical protein Q4D57_06750 [Clostridia bacterium]|nr:hypothetical protein [Clostridia bacterium]
MNIKKSKELIRCKYCGFVRENKIMSNRFCTAYECGNFESPYYKSLLNVDPMGNKLHRISWQGCIYGERRLVK